MKRYLVFIILFSLIVSCSSLPQEDVVQTAIAQTGSAQTSTAQTIAEEEEKTAMVQNYTNTPNPTNTPRPTNTKAPTEIPTPTATPTLEPTIDTSAIIAKNFLASSEQNGVIVEVGRILIGAKESVDDALDLRLSTIPIMEDKTTVVEFVFRIVNNTDKIIKFYFDMETIVSINGEQVVLDDYWLDDNTWFGDDLGSEILPGSTLIGGLWTGIKRSEWDEIEKITISIPEAFEPDSYNDVTNSFYFEIEVSDWAFEELPDELQ